MANGRCRMHGGKSTGAPKGNNNAYVHGEYTDQAVALRKSATALRRALSAKIDFALMMGRGMLRTEKTEALHRKINEQVAAALTMNREATLQAKQRARSDRQRRRED
jgi:hypothetical protein